ncbi:MAG: hypothetical protein ABIJ03_03375 [Patescibacteria group bacterium]|nr:hypothetical protein [Patescibacteria group bacterium]
MNKIDSGFSIRNNASKKELYLPWLKMLLGFSLLATIVGVLFSTKTLADVNKNIELTKEVSRPANVKIIKITTPDCVDCFNIDRIVDDFKKLNIKIEEEQTLIFDSPEANEKVLQFAIKKVPTFLVTGELTKSNIENFVKSQGQVQDDTFVFTKVTPVYIDPDSKQKVGQVVATILTDPSCPLCVDPKLMVESLKQSGVKIIDQKEVIWNSLEGQQIIKQYKILKIPTFLLSPEIDLYDDIKSNWTQLGTVEQDQTYVARNLIFPYRDLEKNEIVGFVDLIYLIDSSCVDCYKVQDVQYPILTNGYGVAIRSEREIDISSAEGKNLVAMYDITKVPTILLSPEVDKYPNLKRDWPGVGVVGPDGWYIFTVMNQLGKVTHKDLASNQIINPVEVPNPSSVQ